jgi:hypothetical protein
MDPKEAAKLLEADRQERGRLCAEAIQAALQQYQCTLVPVLGIVGERIAHRVEIQAQ